MIGLTSSRPGRSRSVAPALLFFACLASLAAAGCGEPQGDGAPAPGDLPAQAPQAAPGPVAQAKATQVPGAEWGPASFLNTPRFGHTARRLTGGEVLVAGGFADVIPQAIPGGSPYAVSWSAELYDPVEDLWLNAPGMNIERVEHAMVTLPGNAPPDGGALVVGGRNDFGSFLYDAEVYEGQSWQLTPPLAEARARHTATRLADDRVLVAGGYSDGGGMPTLIGGAQLIGAGYVFLCSAEIYDAVAGEWTTTGPMNECRADHAEALLPDGRVLVTGGEQAGVVLPSAEAWSPTTNTWTTVAPMASPRTSHTATRLASGKILVTGGTGASGDVASAEVYDPAANAWAPVGSMSAARTMHTAVLLDDGHVLVSGGYGDGVALSTAELFDPATGTFSQVAPMMEPRARHSATLLAGGDVLVAGGDNVVGDPPVVGSAEVFSLFAGTGGPCAVASDCDTGFCVDGVCCDTACDQPCEACTIAARGGGGGLDGACGPVVKGQDPADDCAATPASGCGTTGACNGKGTCELHATGTVCQPATCAGTVAEAQRACDGKGVCLMSQAKDCAPYACSAGGCLQGCKVQTDCAPAAYCDAVGTCKPKLADGTTASDPVQCLSGFAVDGVCCDTACDQECQACAKDLGAVKDGVCSPLSNVQCDDGTACTKLDVCQAGACVGMQPVNCPADTGCAGGLACDPKTGQCSVPLPPKNPGDPCDDGDVCTTGDTCDAAAACAGAAVACTPGECQSGGQCVEGVGCQFDAEPDYTECTKDDDPCTAEVCKSGLCVFNNNLDGVPCPGGTCFAGQCIPDGGSTSAGAGGGTATGGAGAGGAATGGAPAGGGEPGTGGAATGGGGAAAAGGGGDGYALLGGACAVPAGGSGGPGPAAALALLGLAGLRRRRRN